MDGYIFHCGFVSLDRSSGFNTLTRFLKSNGVIRMKNNICEKQNLKAHEVICNTEEDVFIMPHIVLLAAFFLSDELFYDIYNYYLVSRPAEMEKQNKERVREKAFLLLKELGIKINQRVKWDSFDISFAYYLIKNK